MQIREGCWISWLLFPPDIMDDVMIDEDGVIKPPEEVEERGGVTAGLLCCW